MENLNSQYSFTLFCTAVMASGLVSVALCLAAEFKKPKKSDLRIHTRRCNLPESSAFGLGIAALICLSVTQVIGNLFICRKFRSGERSGDCNIGKASPSCILLVFSWIFFVAAVILLSGAASMSQTQPYGEGWLDGDCYLVKNGVYVGSGLVGLLALGSALISGAISTRTRRQAEENKMADE